MTRTAENARRIAADIVRLAKSADPDDYNFSTALVRMEEADVIDTITQDLLSGDLHTELDWIVELILADTTAEEDAAAAQDLQYDLLQWIAAE